MEDYPKTLQEFEKRFSTEDACREYLFQLRWPNSFCCPRCNHGKAWSIGQGLFKCIKCNYKVSIIAGTIFEGTRKPLSVWFKAIWWIVSQKNGASALGLHRILGLGSYETAWSWLHKMRRAMVRHGRDRLSGEIEVDEAYIGGKKSGKRGRGALGKTLVIIMAQIDGKHIGRIRLQRVMDASAENLEHAIKNAVLPWSVVRTDGWNGYNHLSSLNYSHKIVRDDADVGNNLLPRCNRVAALLKRWLLGTHQGAISHEHLDYYLDEYTFRFNRSTSRYRGKLFYRFLQQAVITNPVPYSQVAKGVRGRKPVNHNI